MNTVGELPHHLYVYVDNSFIYTEEKGYSAAVWFGLVSITGRSWGCTVMLESGAIYRNLPPHAIAFSEKPEENWSISDAQTWDCYGQEFSAVKYKYLTHLDCKVKLRSRRTVMGEYLFSVMPINDGFSLTPEQSKEFTFVQTESNRLTIQPTNQILFIEKSFTNNKDLVFPEGLKRQTEIYSSED